MASQSFAAAADHSNDKSTMTGDEDSAMRLKPPATANNPENDESGEHQRGHWSKGIEFFLSCVGYAVGIGNIWRFPYMCIKNGGGAFLIPFFFFLFICGMPLFLLELILGQFSSLSPITMWSICPLFKGVGLGMVIVSGIVCVYFNVIMAWSIYYLFMSLRTQLPWTGCNNEWNTPRCVDKFAISDYSDNTTTIRPAAGSDVGSQVNASYSPSEEFWRNYILGQTDSPDDFGTINMPLLGCLVLAWVSVFLCMFKGVQTSGKVVYVTAVAPYIFLAILLVRGVTLPGAIDGLIFYLKPDFAQLLNYQVWIDACLQIFFSLGPAWGGLITMASFNKFNYNCYRDAFLVSFIDAGTCFVGGLVIFSVLGNMAYETGASVQDFNRAGPGLAFVVYPAALTHLPLPQLWAVLFFAMLLTLGIDTQFGMFETVVSGVLDQFQSLRKRKTLVIALLAVFEFLMGVPFVTGAGYYYFQILNHYAAALSVTLMALLECLVVGYIYGIERLYSDMELMFGKQPFKVFKVFWMYITPFLLFIIVVSGLTQFGEPVYSVIAEQQSVKNATDEYKYPLYVQIDLEYPRWLIGLGWISALSSLLVIPGFMIYGILKTKGSFSQRVKKLCRPTPMWAPSPSHLRGPYLAKYANKDEPVPVAVRTSLGDKTLNDGDSLLGKVTSADVEMKTSSVSQAIRIAETPLQTATTKPAQSEESNAGATTRIKKDNNDNPFSTVYV